MQRTQTGHSLDPNAPVVGVDPFTPPLWGKYEVANITSYSRLGAGAYLTIVSIGLLAVAYYYRDTDVTVGEVPTRLRGGIDGIRDRIGGGSSGGGSPAADEDATTPTPGRR